MKDKSLKDRTHYELQWFNNDDNEWVDMVVYDTKKKAKQKAASYIFALRRVNVWSWYSRNSSSRK